jgi:hypothetical protein
VVVGHGSQGQVGHGSQGQVLVESSGLEMSGDGRRETGDGRREMGDGRREMGDGRFDEEMMEEDFSAERSRPFRMWWPRCGDVSDAHEDKSWC